MKFLIVIGGLVVVGLCVLGVVTLMSNVTLKQGRKRK